PHHRGLDQPARRGAGELLAVPPQRLPSRLEFHGCAAPDPTEAAGRRIMIPALLVLASYLLGAIPTSYIAGRWTRGIDLREHGSGNLGATNTFRVLGARVAAPVMVVDVAKGFLPALLFPRWDGTPEWTWALAYGA